MSQVACCPDDERLSIWYARPAPHLLRYLTAYDSYHAQLAPGEEARDVLPPAWAAMRFAGDGFNWGARLGRRTFDPGPRNALFGPTSHAGYTRFGSGGCVCVGLTPLGWARFVRRDAASFADRVMPLEVVWPDLAERLGATVREAADPAQAFDSFFTELLDRTEPEPPEVAQVAALLLDRQVLTIGHLTERTGIDARHIARLSTRYFGFTPKLLLRRARFMRTLIESMRAGRGAWKALVVDAGYHDQPHFIRDCQLFLGMPISAFMQRPKPLFELSLKLRTQVVGAPAQVLHPVEQ